MIVDYSINVIDLDKTLLPYDSFRLLIKQELHKFDIAVSWYTLLRIMRILSMKAYKEKIIKHLEKKYSDNYFKEFARNLRKDFNQEVLHLIQQETTNNTINILLSASPDMFVKHLIKELNYKGVGSYFNEKGDFIHLYKKAKINWLFQHFKKGDYTYNFAISDSDTDNELLSLFNRNIKWLA